MSTIYEKLSQERKELQAQGLVPEWMTTGGWQLFKEKYLWEARGLKDTYERIAKTAAQHTDDPDKWAAKFLMFFGAAGLLPLLLFLVTWAQSKVCQ